MGERPQTSQADGRVVVVVGQGQSVRAMGQSVLEASEGRAHDLVIEMRTVDLRSSQGVALLLGVRARQRARQRKLTLVCGSDSATEQALSHTGTRGKFTTVTEIS